VKFIASLSSSSAKKYYQFTAIDDCTRLRVLRIYDRLNQKTAIQFADSCPASCRSGSRRSRPIFKMGDVCGMPWIVRPVV